MHRRRFLVVAAAGVLILAPLKAIARAAPGRWPRYVKPTIRPLIWRAT